MSLVHPNIVIQYTTSQFVNMWLTIADISRLASAQNNALVCGEFSKASGMLGIVGQHFD